MTSLTKLFFTVLILQQSGSIALLPSSLNSYSARSHLRCREPTLFAVIQKAGGNAAVDVVDNPPETYSNDEDDKHNLSNDLSNTDEMKSVQKAVTASLLRKGITGNQSRSGSVSANRVTSVGARRTGSATKARNRRGSIAGKIMGCVTSAAIATSKGRSEVSRNLQSDSGKKSVATPKKTVITSAIDSLVQKQIDKKQGETLKRSTLADHSLHKSPHSRPPVPIPEEVSTLASARLSSTLSSDMNAIQYRSVRVARPSDDKDIADLRVSVFSEFSPELKREFCRRSCEVLNNRRLKGATCLVACDGQMKKLNYIKEKDICIAGSVECSTHEFSGTELGRQRPGGTVLYITEVAVSPSSRRSGVGSLLMKGVDALAEYRNIETIYLHVDVQNDAACALYQKVGYEILDVNDSVYKEFTTSLNLHDGATKGRNHHLMCKNITKHQTWLSTAALGFEL